MLKKLFKKLLLALVILPSILLFNGCSIGVCTLQFETWGGSGPRDIVMTPGDSLDSNKFYDAVKTGYNFDCWCYDKDLTQAISFPMVATNGTFTYYAKYELDINYFINNNEYITWSNSQKDIYIDCSLNPYTQLNFMLDKNNISYAINNITIEPTDTTPGQGFMVNGFEVYDEQGKTVEDADTENKDIFVPSIDRETTDTYMYVLRVTVDAKGGNFRIKINGKTSN